MRPLTTHILTGGKMAPKTIGRFKVGKQLGSGNQGTVYLCADTELQRRVAIKLLNKSIPEVAYHSEARAMSKLQHPNIVSIYEAGINNELIINTAPDLVMAYGVGSESAGYVSKIKELGIRVMFNADYLEENALAKAEWIKVFGALFCMENLADSIYGSLSRSYYSMKSYISSHIKVKPHVLLGMPFRDTWFISPGNSFAARFIEDAGGDYLWKDTFSSSSIPLSLENVYFKAIEADYWLNTGALTKKDEIASLDPRLLGLKCYQTGNIYNNNKRMSPGGGNDYWESGTINPHVILKDIASILHPGLFGDYEPVYYRKIK